MYNRYQGNTGRVSRVYDDTPPRSPAQQYQQNAAQPRPAQENMRPPRPVAAPGPVSIRPPSPLSGLSGELGRLLSRLSPMKLETDDLLLMMVLYLMYRESHDDELLFIMAAMFFL